MNSFIPGARLIGLCEPTGFIFVDWESRRPACHTKSGCIIQRENLIG